MVAIVELPPSIGRPSNFLSIIPKNFFSDSLNYRSGILV